MAAETSIENSEASVAPQSQTPYQLDLPQINKAYKVLQKCIVDEKKSTEAKLDKPNLLDAEGASDEEGKINGLDTSPIEMILTSKKHISDRTRLKPYKVRVPNPFNTRPDANICLIVADPQRLYKDAIADSSFPKDLRTRVARIIGLSKLKAKYKSFESRRQLVAEHDFFLADSRIITYLPQALGKIFYRGHTKRPIPVEIGGPLPKGPDGKRIKRAPGEIRRSTKGTDGSGAAYPSSIAKEVEKALNSAIVHLSTSNTTAVKAATASMTPEQCTSNIQTIIEGITSRILPGGWKNIRAIHIKGQKTPAFPIWLASELWVDDADVLEEKKVHGQKRKRAKEATSNAKGPEADSNIAGGDHGETDGSIAKIDDQNGGAKKSLDTKKQKRSQDAREKAASSERKKKLQEQKAAVLRDVSAVA